jgi:hypothetical protein
VAKSRQVWKHYRSSWLVVGEPNLPAGEIAGALKSGAIDASEWIGPWNDMALGTAPSWFTSLRLTSRTARFDADGGQKETFSLASR